ncbi:MAG: GNAT family N-acetyltransferase [Eubacteriaceae bacterium]|nr:GNAT family N-acetyltransferase [Eubacteriaceae bacterium]
MNHIYTQTLSTPRLTLRRAEMKDAEKLFENWGRHDDTTRYVLWDTHKDVFDTRVFLRTWVNSYVSSDVYRWIIVITETDEPVGTISVGSMNKLMGICDVGYSIGPSFWGKGYATEALGAVVEFLFTKVRCNKITASYMAENENSGNVMRKCGMTQEKLLRNRNLSTSTRKIKTDVFVYSLKREEYFSSEDSGTL